MRKIILLFLALSLALLSPLTVYAKTAEKLDFVEAKAVVLMCNDTKEVLYSYNDKEHLSPASVTKIMTILLVLEALEAKKIKLSDKVTASENAVAMGGSQIWLEKGETMTVEELLKAVVIASANDACTALAEYVGGSVQGFVKMMNERAGELGCENTNFENSNGLDDTAKNHYSCAYDLALISAEVMKHKEIVKYSTVWLDSLRGGKTELNNTNKLVNTYNGITGLKTGTTSNAGFCIAATASREGLNLVAVVLGSETSDKRFDTATNLLDFGFANYKLVKANPDVKKIRTVKVTGGDKKEVKPVIDGSLDIIINKSDENFSYNYNIHKRVNAPISKGDSLGHIDIIGESGLIKSINVVSPCDISKTSFKHIFTLILKNI